MTIEFDFVNVVATGVLARHFFYPVVSVIVAF